MKPSGRLAKGSIVQLRQRIDAVDSRIIRLLEARFAVIESIGRLKAARGFPVRDAGRMKEVMNTRLASAAALGLPRAMVKKIYTEIIAHSMRREKKYLKAAGGKRYGTKKHT